MQMYSRMLVSGAVLLALGAWSLAANNRGLADDSAGVSGQVQKVADALGKGDADQAKKLAAEIAKSTETEDFMGLMALRRAKTKKPVFGVGAKPGAVTPDGIEALIMALSKRPDKKLIDKNAEALAVLAHRVEAIALVASAKVPEKDEGQKKKKDWLEWSSDMGKSAKELAKAAEAKSLPEVKAAAAKLTSTCNNCHGVFRD
ncbi:MAG TPA: cytochrome c [Gemmataceae bacterium]|nr:cytochrome c [Gemmataceae bacterium]